MGGKEPESNGPDRNPLADDAETDLFELTARPAVEYALTAEGPVVRRVNPAFAEVFGADEESDLAALLSTVIVSEGGGEPSVLEQVPRETRERVTRQCQTPAGVEPFRIRTIPADGAGYVVFETAVSDDRVSVLEYLTHSLRNPLEVATIHTEMADETGSVDSLGTVRAAHDRMSKIIADAKRLAQQGGVVDETEPVDVASVASDAWETVHTDGATLEIDSPGTVDADERGLRVLLENLFRNSVEHGSTSSQGGSRPDDSVEHGSTSGSEPADSEDAIDPADGTLTVTGGTIDADAGSILIEGESFGFYVADDGPGIPAGERADVLDAGYTTAETGTGLGLSIVQSIAEAHGWTVEITESRTGGARIELTGIVPVGRAATV